MTTFLRAVTLLLATLLAGSVGGAADDKKKEEEPKEQAVVEFRSKTHGAVEVRGVSEKPVDYFDILKDGKRAFAGNPKLLGNSVDLAPGEYVVEVNRTKRTVTVEAGKKIVFQTGEIVVEGKPETAFWYPLDGKERRLAGNPPLLNRARAFFPGKYTVLVHVGVGMEDANLGTAEVKPGMKTVLKH